MKKMLLSILLAFMVLPDAWAVQWMLVNSQYQPPVWFCTYRPMGSQAEVTLVFSSPCPTFLQQ